MHHPPELYVGLMSGTSLDGVDAALVDLSRPEPELLKKNFLPFDSSLKDKLLALHLSGPDELHRTQIIGNQLASIYAAAVEPLYTQAKSLNTVIKAIGCHGQTIRHCPQQGYSIQIGNAALLAELTGITVVSDFRNRDIAAGGQGAPLVPAFHDEVLRHTDKHRVIVNIGGISNLTNLPLLDDTTGFDCGPGNLLMDAWCVKHTGKPYDENGAWGSSGTVLPALLAQLFEDPYYTTPPPKSTGRDLFNMGWLLSKLTGKETPADVQATLLELTCKSIALSIQLHCGDVTEVYLCGGGAHNQALYNRLAALLTHCSIQTTDVLGIDSDYMEAIAFAWLAQQTMLGKPSNLPKVTGAKHPCVLGTIHPV